MLHFLSQVIDFLKVFSALSDDDQDCPPATRGFLSVLRSVVCGFPPGMFSSTCFFCWVLANHDIPTQKNCIFMRRRDFEMYMM